MRIHVLAAPTVKARMSAQALRVALVNRRYGDEIRKPLINSNHNDSAYADVLARTKSKTKSAPAARSTPVDASGVGTKVPFRNG